METITNVASAASKAIWGEQKSATDNETGGQEPISGEQGKGTANEPFDQGNSEDPIPRADANQPTQESDTSKSTSNPPSSSTNMSETTRPPNNPVNAAQGGDIDPHQNTEKTGVIGGTAGGGLLPSERPTERASNPGAAPDSGAPPIAKQQGADKPGDAPIGHEEQAVKDKKDDAEEILKNRDPNDHSGEPMKMHDGGNTTVPNTQEERRTSKVGMPGGQEHGKEPKGTGEQWVKSTGMAVDGGDFDATKPGAGREADRLMEEKGIKKNDPAAESTTEHSDAGNHKDKESMGSKIKNKLHIGHKH